MTLSGRLPLKLPIPNLRLARLPALVALKAPAEAPLMRLWLVIAVLLLLLVLVVTALCAPEDELVTLVLVV